MLAHPGIVEYGQLPDIAEVFPNPEVHITV